VRRLVRCLAIVALALPASLEAGSPLAGFALRAESEHFAFYSHDGAPDPDVKGSERFLASVEQALGHQVSGRSQYYIVGHPADVYAATGLHADGVTSPAEGWILSVRGYHPHEIVHRVAGELGDPGLLFHEGLAVALGERGRLQGEQVDELARRALGAHPFEDFMTNFRARDALEAYAVAGSFVGHLLRRHSAARLADFFRACERTGRPCPKAFARVFGQSLADAVADWQQSIA
jgi:hypothetical protein